MDFLGTNEPEYDPNRCTTMSFSHQPYDLNAVEPKEIKHQRLRLTIQRREMEKLSD
ncbi:unnamed protein product [Oikopleura dioica]|uniref:Uncharacterized protein n=1 Tax=Oikopleura dioica TaxID=34765 RepID=E4YTW8_OIKDI|nr:unnamed protein product [Oikopleura dioica]